jgi:hypothetical protein
MIVPVYADLAARGPLSYMAIQLPLDPLELFTNRALACGPSQQLLLPGSPLLSGYFYSLFLAVDITHAILTPLEDG